MSAFDAMCVVVERCLQDEACRRVAEVMRRAHLFLCDRTIPDLEGDSSEIAESVFAFQDMAIVWPRPEQGFDVVVIHADGVVASQSCFSVTVRRSIGDVGMCSTYAVDGPLARWIPTRLIMNSDREFTTKVIDPSRFSDSPTPADASAKLTKMDTDTMYRALRFISQPSRFIVKMTPDKVKPADAPKIPRQHERPTYTLLTPGEIKTRFLLPGNGPHVDHSPHWRRAHLRRLTSEKFVHKKDQLVPVKSCWVGPDEFKQGSKTYKVLYDL